VKDTAFSPKEWMAMASRAMDIRSPVVSSISISRRGGSLDIWRARAVRSSVVSAMAETTTTTLLPRRLARTIRAATALMRRTLETELPPYFWTIIGMVLTGLTWLLVHIITQDNNSAETSRFALKYHRPLTTSWQPEYRQKANQHKPHFNSPFSLGFFFI